MSGVSLITGGMISTATSGAGVTDWTADEKKQIRSALGITGDKVAIGESELSPMKLLPFTV